MVVWLILLACAPRVSPPEAPADAACPRVYGGHRGIASLPAFEWVPGGLPKGFDPEVVALISEELGCTPLWVDAEQGATEARFTVLEEGAADFSVFQISITPERGERVDFTRPYAADGIGLIVGEGSAHQSLSDVSAGRIVASPETTAAAWVAETLPDATVRDDVPTWQGVKDCFEDGACDALAGDHSALAYGSARDDRVRLLGDGPYTREPWGIAVALGDDALRLRLDEALAKLEANGKLPALREKWGITAP